MPLRPRHASAVFHGEHKAIMDTGFVCQDHDPGLPTTWSRMFVHEATIK